MALPKYKQSRSKTRSRRAQYLRISAPNLTICPNCGAYKLPHRVCPECGFYKKRQVITIKVKEKKKKNK